MNADMEIDFWRTDFHTINDFSQFCRDWQPRDESWLPVLAVHGSLTQSSSPSRSAQRPSQKENATVMLVAAIDR